MIIDDEIFEELAKMVGLEIKFEEDDNWIEMLIYQNGTYLQTHSISKCGDEGKTAIIRELILSSFLGVTNNKKYKKKKAIY